MEQMSKLWDWIKSWFTKKAKQPPVEQPAYTPCDCPSLTPSGDRSLAPEKWGPTEIHQFGSSIIRCIGNKGQNDYTLTKVAFDNGLLKPVEKDGIVTLNEKCGVVNGVRFHYEGHRTPKSEGPLITDRPAAFKAGQTCRPQWRAVK